VLKYRIKYDDGREQLTGLQGARIFRGRPPAWARAAGARRKNGTDRENGAEWGGRGTDEAVDRKGKAKEVERDPPDDAETKTGQSSRPWHGPEVGWFLRLLGDEYSPDQQGFQATWAKNGTGAASWRHQGRGVLHVHVPRGGFWRRPRGKKAQPLAAVVCPRLHDARVWRHPRGDAEVESDGEAVCPARGRESVPRGRGRDPGQESERRGGVECGRKRQQAARRRKR
jgi:hypothetical protein